MLFFTKRHLQHGFTLIELLCVLAVVVILAAILIPAIASVRENSQLARSVANVRSLQNVNLLHMVDHGGKGAPINGDGAPWYRNKDFLFYLNEGGTALPEGLRSPLAETTHGGRGYGANISTLDIEDRNREGGLRVDITLVLRPERKLAWIDGLDWWVMRQYADRYRGQEEAMVHTPAYRYDGKAAVAFFDGHATALTREEVVGNLELWNIYQ